ncbi:MAG TPA: DUF1003 domain-containing protein [Phenylobacterium sp.]|nr:DUF1003 domain-containing protein [Phenylobacterium sp.]
MARIAVPRTSEEEPRERLSRELLSASYSELTPIQRSVIDLVCSEAPSGANPALKLDTRKFGDRLADHVAAVGGSWGFIIGFGVALTIWIAWNVWGRGAHLAFDPYPFIFLNLMLSMLAAIQAPVIMMSQNRAANRDREAAEHDYSVNLRAELEIMHLHDKVDAMRERQMIELLKRQNEAIRLLKAQVEQLSRKRS